MVRENTKPRQTTLSPNVALLFCQYQTSKTSINTNQQKPFPFEEKCKKPAKAQRKSIDHKKPVLPLQNPEDVVMKKQIGENKKVYAKKRVFGMESSDICQKGFTKNGLFGGNFQANRQLPSEKKDCKGKQQKEGKTTSNSGRPRNNGYKTAKSKNTISESTTTTTTCHSDSNSSTSATSSSSRRHMETNRPKVNIATLIAPGPINDPYSASLASNAARPLQTSSRRNRTSNSFSNTNFQKVHSSNNYCNNNNNRSNNSRYKNVKNTADFFAGMAAAPEATALPQPPQAWLDKRSERIAAKLKYNGLEPVVGKLFDSFKELPGNSLLSISA